MLLKKFYQTIINREKNAVTFLREKNLLISEKNLKPCHLCGSKMRERKKRDNRGKFKYFLKCEREDCETSRSIQTGDSFSYFTNINKKLGSSMSLCEILELMYFFVLETPVNTTMALTGRTKSTVDELFNVCREVCGCIVSHRLRGRMVGIKNDPIEIDKVRFVDKSKAIFKEEVIDDELNFEDDDINLFILKNENLIDKMDRPCIFGLRQGSDFRYFFVKGSNKDALRPIIEQECEKGSVIQSDDWPGYENLDVMGYNHFIRSGSGTILSPLEQTQLGAKIKFLKSSLITQDQYQSHLDHFCWKMWRKDADDLFLAFLKDFRSINL